MDNFLERKAYENKALAMIGLESIEGLPHYDFLTLMNKKEKGSFDNGAICCKLGDAMAHWTDVVSKSVQYKDADLAQKILQSFYQEYPELNNSEKPFVFEADFGQIAVKGNAMVRLPR